MQAWFGLSAGGPVDPAAAVDLLTRCGVAANPHQLGVDEGTFRGVLRHTVRFAVGEFLPYSVLNEADVNVSTGRGDVALVLAGAATAGLSCSRSRPMKSPPRSVTAARASTIP